VSDIPTTVVHGLRALLCDADGNLFPSEEPAFAASVDVTNRYLQAHGVPGRLTAEELRRTTTGKNFRTTATDLVAEHGLAPTDLDHWIAEEKAVVTAHLSATLRPDPTVLGPITALADHLLTAAVSSSALSRLDGCFTATGLDELIPAERRFSAEDSLPRPTSKPDPAVYLHACRQLGIAPQQGLAVEDSVPGATSAVAAGCPTVGNLQFVPPAERPRRAAHFRAIGVLVVVDSWPHLTDLVLPLLETAPAELGTRA